MDSLNNSTVSSKQSSRVFFDDFEIEEEWLRAYKLYYIIIDSVFILPTIFGNVLVLLAIWRFPALRRTTSGILIGNLAISDLLVGAVVYPTDLMTITRNDFNTNLTLCLWQQCFIYTLLVASVLNLFILSLERFHAIRKPLTHVAVFTKRRVYAMCFVIWVFVTTLGCSPLLGWHREVDLDTFVCRGSRLADKVYGTIMSYITVTALVINTVFFFILVRVALKATSELKLKRTNSRHWSDLRVRRDIRHTRMMLIVSGLFIVLWAPFSFLIVIPNPSNTLRFITSWFVSLGMINSSTNWIIYGLRSMKFRAAFYAILVGKLRQSPGTSEMSTSMSLG